MLNNIILQCTEEEAQRWEEFLKESDSKIANKFRRSNSQEVA